MSKKVRSAFKDKVAPKPSKTSTGGNETAAQGDGMPVVVGVSGLPGKASGLKPPSQ